MRTKRKAPGVGQRQGQYKNHTIGQAFCATNLPQAQAFQIPFLPSFLTVRQVYTIFKLPNSERLYKGLSDFPKVGRMLAQSAILIAADRIAPAKIFAVCTDTYRRNSRNVRYPRGSAASHWPGSVFSVPPYIISQTVRPPMSNNNVTHKEDLSPVQLAERTEQIKLKLQFLKEATRLIIKDVDENGGGRDIQEASCGSTLFFDETIAALNQLNAALLHLHVQGKTQKADRKEQGAA